MHSVFTILFQLNTLIECGFGERVCLEDQLHSLDESVQLRQDLEELFAEGCSPVEIWYYGCRISDQVYEKLTHFSAEKVENFDLVFLSIEESSNFVISLQRFVCHLENMFKIDIHKH